VSRNNHQEYLAEETDSFEAFDLVTEALESIDSYDPSRKNVEVLKKAQSLLTEALSDGKDPEYLKARYFQAIASYMEGKPEEAIGLFGELLEKVNPGSAFGQELGYNTAAAYSAAGNWEVAIARFDEVIRRTQGDPKMNRRDNPELRLLARAGRALSYAGRIGAVEIRLERLRDEEGEGVADSKRRNEERIKKYSDEIKEQYKLARADAKKVLDREVVKEAEQVIHEAYEKLKGGAGYEVVELLPAEAPKKRRSIFAGVRRVIVRAVVVVVILAIFVQIVVGWDNLLKLLKLLIPG